MAADGHLFDLACGDGFLLERARTAFPLATLSGLDMSEAELAQASSRLADHDCHLYPGRADALPFAGAGLDVVTCHMALMLMTPLDDVLAEVRRVLRPGGRLVAVTSGERQRQSGAYDVFLSALSEVAGFADRAMSLGDRRLRSETTCRAVLAAAGFADVSYEPLPVRFVLLPGSEWAFFAEMYTADWLTDADTAALQQRFAERTDGMRQADGSLILEVGLTAMTAVCPYP